MKKIVSIILLTVTSLGLAQNQQTILEVDSIKAIISLEGGVSIQSSSITNSLINKVYSDGFFTNEVKQDVVNRLDKFNTRYSDNSYIQLGYKTGGKKINWSVNLRQRSNSFAQINANFLKLTMYGNKQFRGQDLNLGNTIFVTQLYQSLGFGLEKNINKFTFGGSLNVLKGSYLDFFSIEDGSLFTAQDGTEILAKGKIRSITSDSHSGKDWSGLGLSFDASVQYDVSDELLFRLEADDIGFIKWKSLKHTKGTIDKALTPYQINLLNPSASFNSKIKLDEILGLTSQNSSFTYRTAGNVHFLAKAKIRKNISMRAGVRVYTTAGAIPLVYLNPMYKLKKHALGLTLQAGGYGYKDIILNYEWVIANRVHLLVNANVLEALLAPSTTSSQGLNASLLYYLR